MNLFRITINFIRHLAEKKYLIYELTKRDFQSKYVANVLGLAWAVLEPLAFMVILWLVFGLGLKGGRSMAIPFHVYLISGISVYLFFSQTLQEATAGIKANSFLVKKVDFRFEILPLVKIFSGLVLHLIVMAIVVVISMAKGIMPSVYWLQLPYYTFSVSVMLLGMSWLTASLVLFVPDVSSLIRILLRFLFYLSPIFWEIKVFPARYHVYFKLNPVYYIIDGYRNSLYFQVPFWADWKTGLYFWGLTLFFLLLGMVTFRKLQPHFADVV